MWIRGSLAACASQAPAQLVGDLPGAAADLLGGKLCRQRCRLLPGWEPSLDITDCCKNSSVESSDLVRRGLSQAGPLLHRVGTRWGVRHWVWAVGHGVGRASTHQGAIVAGGVVGLHRLDLALGVRVPSCCPRLSTRGQIHRDHLVEVALLAAWGGRASHRLPLHLGGQGTRWRTRRNTWGHRAWRSRAHRHRGAACGRPGAPCFAFHASW